MCNLVCRRFEERIKKDISKNKNSHKLSQLVLAKKHAEVSSYPLDAEFGLSSIRGANKEKSEE